MKFYRLSESNIKYGLVGNVIPYDVWQKIPYTDKPLYDQIDEYGRGYAYKVEVKPAGSGPMLFYLESYGDIVILLQRLADRGGVRQDKLPIVIPNTSAEVEVAMNTIKIIYRKEWQQDLPSSSAKDT